MSRLVLLATLAVSLAVQKVEAQLETGRGVPSLPYYGAMNLYNSGDYRRAFDAFRSAARMGLRFGNDRWADSICYHAMMGECLYQVGEPVRALEEFNQSLAVFLLNRDWMRQVEYPAGLVAANISPRAAVTWGNRPTVAARFQRMQVVFGNPNLQNVPQQGGVWAPPELRSVDVAEIVRCTGLALRRRAELLGPLGPTDPFSSQLLVALEGRIGRANHWSEAWIDGLRGMGLLGMGKFDEAVDLLNRSMLIAGQFDHPLTAQALVEMGRIAAAQQNYGVALEAFQQASLAAARFEQQDVVAEALHHAAAIYWIGGGPGVYGPLLPAAAWAKRQGFSQLYASLAVDLAEQQLAAGELAAAEASLAEAQQIIGRRRLASAQVLARLAFQSAGTHYESGRDKQAALALAQALEIQQAISPWLLQLTILETRFRTSAASLTDREASVLYEQLLREPTETDWLIDPLETLAVKSVPQGLAYESWFELTVGRGEAARAIEISERMRRQRFLARLPMAGRTLALRWLLEAPDERVTQRAGQRRQDLIARFPELNNLARDLENTTREATAIPWHVMDASADERKAQKATIKRWMQAAANYERTLGKIAMRRVDAPESFPPVRSLEQIQSALNDEQLILSFIVTSNAAYGTMISNRNQTIWRVDSVDRTRKGAAALLRELGMAGESSTINEKRLSSERWHVVSQALLEHLIETRQLGFWKRFEELIVVPEDVLWYVPFETLLVDTDDAEAELLINVMRIRYAPTISLAVTPSMATVRNPNTAVVLGQLFPRDGLEVAQDQFAELESLVPGSFAVSDKLAGPSGILRNTWDRLVVFDDLANSDQGPFDWTPAGIDKGAPHTSLTRWLELPWGGPTEIVLPGFHSEAESGLKRNANGEEIELSLLGLMASGARTILISRWRTGGQTAYNLMREYLQERPQMSPAEAWQRAVQVTRDTNINPAWEPRVTAGKDPGATLTASHPFFWSGYLLCDQGQPSASIPRSEEEEMPPAIEPAAEDPSHAVQPGP